MVCPFQTDMLCCKHLCALLFCIASESLEPLNGKVHSTKYCYGVTAIAYASCKVCITKHFALSALCLV